MLPSRLSRVRLVNSLIVGLILTGQDNDFSFYLSVIQSLYPANHEELDFITSFYLRLCANEITIALQATN